MGGMEVPLSNRKTTTNKLIKGILKFSCLEAKNFYFIALHLRTNPQYKTSATHSSPKELSFLASMDNQQGKK